MNCNIFSKLVNKDTIYREFLNSLNGLLKLTEKELQVLSIILTVSPEVRTYDEYTNVVSTNIRRKIMKETGINKANLSTFIKSFIKKKLLIKDSITNAIWINRAIIPIIQDGKATISIVLKIDGTL